jgi:hypothetical protein
MNRTDYLKELNELLDEAYECYTQADKYDNVIDAQYYKGRFHAFNTAILALGDKEVQDRPAGM